MSDNAAASKAPTKAGWVLLGLAWILFLIPFPGLGWIGWVFNFVAFIIAIVVITRGETKTGIIQIACSTIVSGIIYFIGLSLFVGMVASNVDAKHKAAASNSAGESASTRLTGSQNNAARSAEQYLGMQGFSRDGLIQQLSSDAADGYKVADATAAVDSLNIDWNAEAVRSAKQYLDMQGFSCKGLIQQLSSSAGERFTVSQATYGAQQAGACQ